MNSHRLDRGLPGAAADQAHPESDIPSGDSTTDVTPNEPANDIPEKPFQPNVTPEPESPLRTLIRAQDAPKPEPAPEPTERQVISARCLDCRVSFTLSGRGLYIAVDMHERKHGHKVKYVAEVPA